MQMQADYADCTIKCAPASELSALGAAYIGGIRTGVFADFESIPARHAEGKSYAPQMTKIERDEIREAWRTAVRRTLTEK